MVSKINSSIFTKDPDRILRANEVVCLTGLSRTTLWRLERSGDFPTRRRLSSFAVGWVLSEVLEWLESRQAIPAKNVQSSDSSTTDNKSLDF